MKKRISSVSAASKLSATQNSGRTRPKVHLASRSVKLKNDGNARMETDFGDDQGEKYGGQLKKSTGGVKKSQYKGIFKSDKLADVDKSKKKGAKSLVGDEMSVDSGASYVKEAAAKPPPLAAKWNLRSKAKCDEIRIAAPDKILVVDRGGNDTCGVANDGAGNSEEFKKRTKEKGALLTEKQANHDGDAKEGDTAVFQDTRVEECGYREDPGVFSDALESEMVGDSIVGENESSSDYGSGEDVTIEIRNRRSNSFDHLEEVTDVVRSTDGRKKRLVRNRGNDPTKEFPTQKELAEVVEKCISSQSVMSNSSKSLKDSVGFCVRCGKSHQNLMKHIQNVHAKDESSRLSLSEAKAMGFKMCRCGVVCSGLVAHWRHCKLPKSQRGELLVEPCADEDAMEVSLDDSDDHVPANPRKRRVDACSISDDGNEESDDGGWKSRLFQLQSVLEHENSGEADIESVFNVLAELPIRTRMFKSGEVRAINDVVSRICEEYIRTEKPIHLLRLLAMPKYICSTIATDGKIGNLIRRLKCFPSFDDAGVLAEKLNHLREGGSSSRSLEQQVHDKLCSGQIGAAARLLESSLGVATLTPETISKLEVLHPDEEEHSWRVSVPTLPHVSLGTVHLILSQSSRETAGGPSGFDGNWVHILKRNTKFVDLVMLLAERGLTGRLPLRQIFTASRVIPLLKNDEGDVRPIAVGEMLFKLVGQIVLKTVSFSLLPCQFGVGSPGGVEPLIHLCEEKGHSDTIISIDIANAFNSISRDYLHNAVRERAPQLLPIFRWAYSKHSPLYVGGKQLLWSRSGVRQGDPLGPVLFSLGYSQILTKVKSVFSRRGFDDILAVTAYLDDTYIRVDEDEADEAEAIIAEVFEAEKSSGLKLKVSKGWRMNSSTFEDVGADFLGSHIGGNKSLYLASKFDEFEVLVNQLRSLRVQDSMLLMRTCLLPKMTHLMRSVKVSDDSWHLLDDIVLGWVGEVISRVTDLPWNKAIITLPVRMGGLGLTSAAKVHEVAFEASRYASFSYLKKLDRTLDLSLLNVDPRSQSDRVKDIWIELKETLLNDLSQEECRKFVDNSSVLGSKWMMVLPLDAALEIKDGSFSAAIADRLLVQVPRCAQCGEGDVDSNHVQGCRKMGKLRNIRHETLKKGLLTFFERCGAHVANEPKASNSANRGDLRVECEALDGAVIVDISVISTHGIEAQRACTQISEATPLLTARAELRAILESRDKTKTQNYVGHVFDGAITPWVITSGGTCHPRVVDLLKRLNKWKPVESTELMYVFSTILTQSRGKCLLKMMTLKRRGM